MANNKQSRENIVDDARENARVGYQATIEIWSNHVQAIWNSSSAILVTNSILVGIIGLAITGGRSLRILTPALAVVGLVLCMVWFLLWGRGLDYEHYLVMSARELEEVYLANSVKTLSRGGSYADGKVVSLKIDGKPLVLQMSWLSRRFRARRLNYCVIILFVIMYVATIAQVFLN